jgi:hypothetical protein
MAESDFATLHHINLPMMGELMGTAEKQSPEIEKPQVNQSLGVLYWRGRRYQIANRLSFPSASKSSNWCPVHLSKY